MSTPMTTEPIRAVPGGWHGSELAGHSERWRLELPAEVAEDLVRAASGLRAEGVATDPFQRPPDVTTRTRSLVAELRHRLADEPGFVVVTGFPVLDQPGLTEAAYWALGLLLGRPTHQNPQGELLVRVENVGRDTTAPGGQKYRLPEALPFHIDRCTDLIGLLCVRPAEQGGLSRLISCKAVHNALAAERDDLLPVLYQPFPFSMPPLRDPDGLSTSSWCEVPVFSQVNGHFAAHYMRRFVEEAQVLADAPRLTEAQVAALDGVDEVLSRPELPLEMSLAAGDLQLVNNLLVLHSRTAFDSHTPEQGRLLLRLHLAFAGSPDLPAGYAPLFGATAGGSYRGGAWRTRGVRERFGDPVGVSAG